MGRPTGCLLSNQWQIFEGAQDRGGVDLALSSVHLFSLSQAAPLTIRQLLKDSRVPLNSNFT